LPRVREARVSRTLPDTISVDVTERQPAILVKRDSGNCVWLDSDSMELGDVSSIAGAAPGRIPPVATGFAEGNRSKAAIADDVGRILKYKELEREFDQKAPSIWNLINEIELAYYDQDVNVLLLQPPVWVHLGKRDYRNNMDAALKVLDALKRGDADMLQRFRVQDPERCIKDRDNLKFIDAARPERPVLSFSTGAQRGRQESRVGKPPGRRR
jgi:hypothetical protein